MERSMKAFFFLWLCFSFVNYGQALKCYGCKYERTLSDCVANGVVTCKGTEDACFREQRELQRNGRRVVSAGCGRSWRSADGCDDYGGKLRCTKWCYKNLCNGTPGKLSKLGANGSASVVSSIFTLLSPLLLAYILNDV